jgi:hypothetical protein
MPKQSFPIGMLDKAGKNVKTATGWVPVKGNEQLIDKELNANREVAIEKVKTEKAPKEPKQKKETKTQKEKSHKLSQKDVDLEKQKIRTIRNIKKLRYSLLSCSKNDKEFIQGQLDLEFEDLKTIFDYVPTEEELTTKYRGEHVVKGDSVFILGIKTIILSVHSDDPETFTHKTAKGTGFCSIHTIDEEPTVSVSHDPIFTDDVNE